MNTARMTIATDSEGYTHIVGENYTASYTVFDGEDAIYVERIDVDEEVRGQGIGTAVLRGLAREHGAVYVAPDNDDSARLFGCIGEDAWDDNETLANRLDMWTLDQGYGVFVIY